MYTDYNGCHRVVILTHEYSVNTWTMTIFEPVIYSDVYLHSCDTSALTISLYRHQNIKTPAVSLKVTFVVFSTTVQMSRTTLCYDKKRNDRRAHKVKIIPVTAACCPVRLHNNRNCQKCFEKCQTLKRRIPLQMSKMQLFFFFFFLSYCPIFFKHFYTDLYRTWQIIKTRNKNMYSEINVKMTAVISNSWKTAT